VRLPGPNPTGAVVVSWRCVDGMGRRHPSLVQLIRTAPRSPAPQTLVAPGQDMQVDHITVTHDVIEVVASSWHSSGRSSGRPGCCFVPANLGAVVAIDFIMARDGKVGYAASHRIAGSCTEQDLSVSIGWSSARTSRAALLTFVNTAKAVCAIEGYPSVLAYSARSYPTAAAPVLAGPSGGVHDQTAAPLVVIAPGQAATAILESLSSNVGVCFVSRALSVSLPAAGQVALLPFAMRLCEAEVHPVVAGADGSV
jgi:hypothetical protein